MGNITKSNIEKAIKIYLNDHLDIISLLDTDGVIDVKITEIFMSRPFEYTGEDEYEFIGYGEGWILVNDGGKSLRRFKILPSTAFITEGAGAPVVKNIKAPVLIEYV